MNYGLKVLYGFIFITVSNQERLAMHRLFPNIFACSRSMIMGLIYLIDLLVVLRL